MRLITIVIMCTLLGGVLALDITYRLRRARLAQFVRTVTTGVASDREVVFEVGRTLFLKITRGPDPVFLTKLLRLLGASPIAVLEQGGCCSGIHRLFIASLDAIGIRAAQITVYRLPGPVAVHCLVQVDLATAPLIIDVDYGVWYRHPNGGSLGIDDLRAGVIPVIEPFMPSEARRPDPKYNIPPGYPDKPYFAFDFRSTRTANWTKTPVRRATYWLLRHVTRGGVDYLLLPAICEWPENLLAAALLSLWVIIFAAELARLLPI
jgi:hypothetical protein